MTGNSNGSGSLLVAPTNIAAEWSVLGHMLHRPQVIGEVIGLPLEWSDFSQADTRLLFGAAVERSLAGQGVDPLVIADQHRDELGRLWSADPAHVASLLSRRARAAMVSDNVLDHATIVKQLSTSRKLLDACYHALTAISDGQLTPQEIGDLLSTEALQATAGSTRRSELLTWMDTGREYVKQLQRVMTARQQGFEIGVYTGLPFIDKHIAGIGPGELCFIAGEPGSGKTAIAWAAALGFAGRQLKRPATKRVHTLMLSMEMNLYGSTQRMVQNLTEIDGVRLREGAISRDEYMRILRAWKDREGLPLVWNFAANFRLSQMRALIVEAIRRYNTGFIVIDHFRMIDTDRRYDNPNQEDEARVRFIKENIAKDLNVAVLCLAHTVKVGRQPSGETARPRLSDLRGSQMISAFADQIGFMWSPYKYMTERQRDEGFVKETDVKLEWSKNRFGQAATAELTFHAETMKMLPR